MFVYDDHTYMFRRTQYIHVYVHVEQRRGEGREGGGRERSLLVRSLLKQSA